MSPDTLYDVLGGSRNAEQVVIKSAWRALAQKYHLDKCATEAATQKMQAINEAYRVLSDTTLKAKYDRALAGGGKSQPPSPPGKKGSSPNNHDKKQATHPWRRFFAVQVDALLIWFPLCLAVVALIEIGFTRGQALEWQVLVFLYLVVGTLCETTLLVFFKTTFGKWLFGLSVRSTKGEPLSDEVLIKRTMHRLPWVVIPFLPLHAYSMLGKIGTTPWDRAYQTEVTYNKTGPARSVLAALCLLLALIVNGFLVPMAPHFTNTNLQTNPFDDPNFGNSSSANEVAKGSGGIDQTIDWEKGTITSPESTAESFIHEEATSQQPPSSPSQNAAPQVPSSTLQSEATKEHYAKIYRAHPDADDIFLNSAFQDWVQQNPKYDAVISNGSTDQIIEMFSAYKQYLKQGV